MWTPKVQKPTIAGQARAQSIPYPISSSAIASRTNQTISTSTIAAASNLHHHNAIESTANLCRCSTSIQSRAPTQQINTNRPSSTVTSSTIISNVAQVPQPIHQLAPTVRSLSAENATNPMLIVPFATPFAAVPVPMQTGQQPIPNMTRPPPHIQHYPASITSAMPPPPIPSSAMQQHHAVTSYQTSSSAGGNGTTAANSAPVAVLLTPTSCSNNGNMKVN